MCGRYSLTARAADLEQRFGARFPDAEAWTAPSIHLAPSLLLPVVVGEREGRRLRMMRWGFLPHWAGVQLQNKRVINARAETMAEKPFFRNAVKRGRCLVPAGGFYEWKSADGKKIPFRITWPEGLKAMAGLWELRRDPTSGLEIAGFAIVTVAAGVAMNGLHERMPALLSQDGEKEWLESPLSEVSLVSQAHSAHLIIEPAVELMKGRDHLRDAVPS